MRLTGNKYSLLSGNITTPERVQEAMQMQVEAERKKRAAVLESEGKLLNHFPLPCAILPQKLGGTLCLSKAMLRQTCAVQILS